MHAPSGYPAHDAQRARRQAIYSAIEGDLAGLDACLFCLGVSSAGMQEDAYRHITYDFTLAAAKTLWKLNPQLRF